MRPILMGVPTTSGGKGPVMPLAIPKAGGDLITVPEGHCGTPRVTAVPRGSLRYPEGHCGTPGGPWDPARHTKSKRAKPFRHTKS